VNPIPLVVSRLTYAGLIPFIGLALTVQLASAPLNYLAAESLASYGAIIAAFMGALHWGANLDNLGNLSVSNRWQERNAWLWSVMPALIAWVALQIYIPVGLVIIAAILMIQRQIDQSTYHYYFSNDAARIAFMQIRNRATYIASFFLVWAALVMLFLQD
jgi:hypothetical protein